MTYTGGLEGKNVLRVMSGSYKVAHLVEISHRRFKRQELVAVVHAAQREVTRQFSDPNLVPLRVGCHQTPTLDFNPHRVAVLGHALNQLLDTVSLLLGSHSQEADVL